MIHLFICVILLKFFRRYLLRFGKKLGEVASAAATAAAAAGRQKSADFISAAKDAKHQKIIKMIQERNERDQSRTLAQKIEDHGITWVSKDSEHRKFLLSRKARIRYESAHPVSPTATRVQRIRAMREMGRAVERLRLERIRTNSRVYSPTHPPEAGFGPVPGTAATAPPGGVAGAGGMQGQGYPPNSGKEGQAGTQS